MRCQSLREPFAANEGADLNVPRLGRLSEVGRGDESRPLIDNYALCMQTGALGGFEIKGTRVVEHFRQSATGSFVRLKSLGEPTQDFFGRQSSSWLSMYVQKEPHAQGRALTHTIRQSPEDLPPLVHREPGDQYFCFRHPEQLADNHTRITVSRASGLRSCPDEIDHICFLWLTLARAYDYLGKQCQVLRLHSLLVELLQSSRGFGRVERGAVTPNSHG
jgi:hypothetical protein